MKLYGYFRSSCTYRLKIALNFKGIKFDYVPINLLKGEQKSKKYLGVNPQGLVPLLEHNGNLLSQSLAIIEYLEELFPSPSLLPSDPVNRVKVRAMSQIIACDTQPVQNLKVLKYLDSEISIGGSRKQSWGNHFITEGFNALELKLLETAGTFSFGGHLSMVDICLVPQVYNALRFGVDMQKYPLITRVYNNCMNLPAVLSSRPEVQIDCPENLRKS